MKKYRLAAALCAAFILCLSFSTVAYAGGGEETEETTPTESAVEETNPFTPAGTGTVIDNATDEDGKEFYTIMTPDENVFYLIIDRQRETENVYFLNAVTERDLLALAEKSEDSGVSAIPDNTTPAVTEPEPEPTPEPEPEKSGGSSGIIIVVLIALAAGGAGYYFKIYKPKQQADTGADYEAEEDYGDYEDTYDEDAEDDNPPWDDEDADAEEDDE